MYDDFVLFDHLKRDFSQIPTEQNLTRLVARIARTIAQQTALHQPHSPPTQLNPSKSFHHLRPIQVKTQPATDKIVTKVATTNSFPKPPPQQTQSRQRRVDFARTPTALSDADDGGGAHATNPIQETRKLPPPTADERRRVCERARARNSAFLRPGTHTRTRDPSNRSKDRDHFRLQLKSVPHSERLLPAGARNLLFHSPSIVCVSVRVFSSVPFFLTILVILKDFIETKEVKSSIILESVLSISSLQK